MADNKNGAMARTNAAGTPNKTEAVRQALGTLGWAASREQIQKFVWDKFSIQMSTDHISNCKSEIRKQLAKAGRPIPRPQRRSLAAKPLIQKSAAKKEAPPKETAQPAIAARAKAEGISLEDIQAVKALVSRVGANDLKTLIDLLGR